MNDEQPRSLIDDVEDLRLAWLAFVMVIAHALKIDKLLDWLARQLNKIRS